MCAKKGMWKAPQEKPPGPGGIPVKTKLSADKLKQNTEKLLEGAAKTLNTRLRSRMRTQEFLTLYDETIDRTLTAFDNWGRAGKVNKLTPLEIENEILSRTSEKIGRAIGEAITRRIARSFINLKTRVQAAGVTDKLPAIMEELQDGHGDLKTLLNSKNLGYEYRTVEGPDGIGRTEKIKVRGLTEDEISTILNFREGGLSKADVEMINFASKNEIVHKFFKSPKKLPKGVWAKLWRGGLAIKDLVCPEAKKAVIRAYSAAATVRHPLDREARDAMIERLGAYMDKHPRVTRHLRYKRYKIIPLAIGLAIYSLWSEDEEEKQLEGEMPSITPSPKKRRRGPAEDTLYNNGGYTRHNRRKILDLMGAEGIPEEKKAKVASIIVTIPNEFFQEAFQEPENSDLKNMISVLNDLSPLSGKMPKEKIGMAAYNILRFVDPSQLDEFAKELAKKAKTAKQLDAFFASPPAKFKMTEAWLGRPFEYFLEKGFDANDEKLKSLCSTIRRIRLKEGRETVPLSKEKQRSIAGVLAEIYSSGEVVVVPDNYQENVEFLTRMLKEGFGVQTAGDILRRAKTGWGPGVPNYQEDVEFLTRMLKKGFGVQTSGDILRRARSVYKPEHFADAEEMIAPTLQPGMPKEERRLAIERPAFSKRGWARDTWEESPDPRLLDILTEGDTAKTISKDLRKFPQHIYESVVESLVSFTNAWQKEIGTLGNRKIKLLMPFLGAITRSKKLSHLTPKQRGIVLYKIWTSVNLGRNKKKRFKRFKQVMDFLKKKFEGKNPTVPQIKSSVDEYLEENPKLAL
ncbi:hypothetical protein GF415_05310 [Candidatus Micrarchaeota archaeon]|nr:hypothetical protein [Candidatus Micrarchaeota archaeon]